MSSESDGMAKENGPDAPWLMDAGSSHEVAPEDGGPPEAPTQPAGSSSASVHVNGGEEWGNGSMREASMSRISFFVSSSRLGFPPDCWFPLQILRKHCCWVDFGPAEIQTRAFDVSVHWCQNLFSEQCSCQHSV
jgi:hypothetical protein